MVAEACYVTPTPCKLGTVAVARRIQDGPAPKLPFHVISRQDEAEGWQQVKEEDERDQQGDGGDYQFDISVMKKEQQDEDDEVDLQIVDVEDEEDLLDGNGLEEKCSSERQIKEGIRSSKGQANPNWRKNILQKMNHGKMWIANNILLVSTGLSAVSLSDIEQAYQQDCHKEDQEPLTRFVLARLIHQQFPVASKSRRGSRGNQKIHYNKLQLKSNSNLQQQEVNGGTSAVSEGQDMNDKPSEIQSKPPSDSPTEISSDFQRDNIQNNQNKAKRPVSSESPKDLKYKTNSGFHGFQEELGSETIQPLPREEDHDQDGCDNAANRLLQVVTSLKSRGKMNILLQIFAHSSSCDRSSCSSLCRMFRRVRRHVVTARHACQVMHLYSVILKSHVLTCTDDNCGITACPALRASRQVKRGRDDEFQQDDITVDHKQDGLQHTSKRLNRQGKRPSTLTLMMPSPGSPLSDSDGSTPSPGLSPSHVLPRSPVRYPVQPEGINFVPKICDQAMA